MQRIGLVLALGLLFGTPAAAQRLEPRVIAGVTTFADDSSIEHFTAGGALRAYVSRRWSIEPEFLYMRHNGGFFSDRHYVVWGNFAYDLRDRSRRVIPYWMGAPGAIHSRSSFGGRIFSDTEAAVGTGFGVKIFLNEQVFVTPQFRIGMADGIFAELTGSLGIRLGGR